MKELKEKDVLLYYFVIDLFCKEYQLKYYEVEHFFIDKGFKFSDDFFTIYFFDHSIDDWVIIYDLKVLIAVSITSVFINIIVDLPNIMKKKYNIKTNAKTRKNTY